MSATVLYDPGTKSQTPDEAIKMLKDFFPALEIIPNLSTRQVGDRLLDAAMHRTIRWILALVLGLFAPATQGKATTPSEEYQALLKEYEEISRGFRKAETDLERKMAVEGMDKFPRRFLELAEKYPKDPVALEALTQTIRVLNAADSLTLTAWEMNKAAFPDKSKDNSAEKAIALLLRDHIRSDKLGLVCERMRYGIRMEYETFLHEVLKASPHKDVKGLACLSLAEFLKSQLQKFDLIKERPEFAERYKGLLGKKYFEELQRKGHVNLAMEIETLLEQAATTYADVKMPYGDSVGEQAKAELFEIRHLVVGKEASDIEGRDQDGKQFKLSDYRGKVVLLYFWSEY
jgi:hypothetical protein